MNRKRTFAVLSIVAGMTAVALGGFYTLAHAPQTLIPPPSWPFSAEARKNYDPFGEHSRRTVEYHLRQKPR